MTLYFLGKEPQNKHVNITDAGDSVAVVADYRTKKLEKYVKIHSQGLWFYSYERMFYALYRLRECL